jgi:RimJ/RimL family protein N-acetyltransferase
VRSPEELERFAGPSLSWPLTPAQLRACREAPDVLAWTAYLTELGPDTVVGHIEVARTGAHAGRLARVLLDPSRRGQGLGRSMVEAALREARAAGMRRFDLRVFTDNPAAIRASEAAGFRDAGPHDPQGRLRVMVLGAP